MNWENYILRRRIKADEWILRQDIKTREEFTEKLVELGVLPPDEGTILSLFPVKAVEGIINHEPEAASVATERVDTSTTWGVAPQGGGTDLRSSGNDDTKLRARRNK